MNVDELMKRAYAMPLTNPAYPPGPYRFVNREFFIVTYRTDPAALRAVVPEPLEVAEPLVRYEFIRMPDSTGFGDYTESGQVIPVKFRGQAGGCVHAMYLDDEAPIAGGRELWGFPKKLASPSLAVEKDTLLGVLKYGSVPVAVATMGYKPSGARSRADQGRADRAELPSEDRASRRRKAEDLRARSLLLRGCHGQGRVERAGGASAVSPRARAGRPIACARDRFRRARRVGSDPRTWHRRSRLSRLKGVPMKLDGKVAIVTGAASGIGKAIAERYAREGAAIVVADLILDAANTAADEIRSSGGTARGVAMDVTDENAVNAGVAATVEIFGGIDILVSNAGIQIVHPLEEFSYAEWKKMLAIHVDGAFLTTKAVLPHMYKAGRGSIIFMGSVHSKEASLLKAPYVAAKHALIGLAKVIAKEGAAHGVRANVICPGFVRTPLVDKQIPEQSKALGISEEDVIRKVMLKDTVDGQFTTVEDVAEIALLFAAFPSNALTGQSLVVSHGWFMQ